MNKTFINSLISRQISMWERQMKFSEQNKVQYTVRWDLSSQIPKVLKTLSLFTVKVKDQ